MRNAISRKTSYLTEKDKKNIRNRLSRVQGQLNGIMRMVEDGECADKMLIQIAAARSAISSIGKIIVREHFSNCARVCMKGTDTEIRKRIVEALTRFSDIL